MGPVITYAAETIPDTSKTLQMMRTIEMKIIRSTHGKTHDSTTESEAKTLDNGARYRT